ncbi:protein Mpv17 [Ctenocephalides felis]|uniref:protein Mpv17 n=1 Tax=Ctenocephalides felis TaxID=7515 RepID=UPI000E6E4F7A|nr:protein Mpv17 [Ctenocephalides felis]
MRRVLAAYQAMLAKQPFLTQVAQTSLIMGVGDFIAQKFLEKKPFSQYEISRTLGFCFVGATVVAPWLTVWYRTLHRIVKPSKFAPLQKMLMDQILMAPNFTFAIVTSLNLVTGKSFHQAIAETKTTYVDIMKANYCLWPFAQLVNFYMMPLNYQVLFVQVVSVGWNSYISYKTQAKHEKK